MKKPLIVANWKCNPANFKEAKRLFNSVGKGVRNFKKAEVVVCPPFVYLLAGAKLINSGLKLGAQNCFWEEKGAFTGEVSPAQLQDLNLSYVILGHSERRDYFKETDQMINRKIKKSLEFGLLPILCIGENLNQRKQGKAKQVLELELSRSLKGITKKEMGKIAVAYEPIWAIGTGQACPVDEAGKIMLLIKEIIAQLFDKFVSQKTSVLYGGSVNSGNAKAFIREANFDGLLIGGASLKPEEFIKIVKTVS